MSKKLSLSRVLERHPNLILDTSSCIGFISRKNLFGSNNGQIQFIKSLKKTISKGKKIYLPSGTVEEYLADKWVNYTKGNPEKSRIRYERISLIKILREKNQILENKDEINRLYEKHYGIISRIGDSSDASIEDIEIFLYGLSLKENGPSAIMAGDTRILCLWDKFLLKKKISESSFGAYVRRGIVDDFQLARDYLQERGIGRFNNIIR